MAGANVDPPLMAKHIGGLRPSKGRSHTYIWTNQLLAKRAGFRKQPSSNGWTPRHWASGLKTKVSKITHRLRTKDTS